MRFQVGIQITLLVVAIVIAVSVVKPKIDDIRVDEHEVASYETALLNIGRYNEKLQTLINQANALSANDRFLLERYLPATIDAVAVGNDVSNIVSNNKLLLLDIIPGELEPVTAYTPDGVVAEAVTQYDPETGMPIDNQPMGRPDSILMAQQFEVEVVGTYDNMKTMLRDLERNAYPLRVVDLEFSLEEEDSNLIQYSLMLETYALPNN